MKQFLFKFFLFTSSAIVIIGLISIPVHKVNSSDFIAAIIDKHKRLDAINGKRILLVGGSNLAFGIDSKQLESAYHCPVVNMGLHAGLGLNFILKEAQESARSGDVILLSIEYYLGKEGVYKLMNNAAKFYPRASSYFSENYFSKLGTFVEKRKNVALLNIESIFLNDPTKSTPEQISIYDRRSFNEYGDVVGHLDKKAPSKQLKDGAKMGYTYYEGIETLNSFYSKMKQKNVTVYFLYPPYAESQYNLNKEVILKYQRDLEKDMKIPIINKPEDFAYPDSLFFDTVYHLKKEGRETRTKRLIELTKSIVSL